MPATFEIVAVSALVERFRISEGRIRDAVPRLGIRRAGRINGEDHYDEADADRIGRFLTEREVR